LLWLIVRLSLNDHRPLAASECDEMPIPSMKPYSPYSVVQGFFARDNGMSETGSATALTRHGAGSLSAVDVDSYNVESRDDEGFLGDRASKKAFRAILDNWRKVVRKRGDDPFGDEPTEKLSRKELDAQFTDGDPEAAGIVQGAIEEFAQELALVIRQFLKLKRWRDTECIAVGGGFRESRVGEVAIGRAGVILKADGLDVALAPIHHAPDDAGLIGAVYLVPAWTFRGYDGILAVDIGGTNIRAGIVSLNLKRDPDLSKAEVYKSELWRHADEKLKRDEAVDRLTKMLEKLIAHAGKEGVRLAPFIGIGCPGLIEEDGSIDRGAQNLPGNWASKGFNLPAALCAAIPSIGKHDTTVVMHNDAVVQGLSELPWMRAFKRWGVLTVGTGLGNARFTNRNGRRE
jgi:predicted NBD/HSP70 family sugar kinase